MQLGFTVYHSYIVTFLFPGLRLLLFGCNKSSIIKRHMMSVYFNLSLVFVFIIVFRVTPSFPWSSSLFILLKINKFGKGHAEPSSVQTKALRINLDIDGDLTSPTHKPLVSYPLVPLLPP